jgi:hypothetical protein
MLFMHNASVFTSPLAGEAERRRFGEGVREGGKRQTLIVPLTALPSPPPQGGREFSDV